MKLPLQTRIDQSLSRAQLFVTPWIAHARPSCPSPTPGVHWGSRPSTQWCHPAISSYVFPLLLLPPIPPSIRDFSNESTLHMRWPKNWSFSFSIIPSKEIPGLISFRMNWLDLLPVQRALKSLPQHQVGIWENEMAALFHWCVALLPSEKGVWRHKCIIREKEDHYIMIQNNKSPVRYFLKFSLYSYNVTIGRILREKWINP